MSSLMTGLQERNRWIRRLLLGIVATLVVASFLVGIRW
jgi:hypothetical protein